MRVYNPEWQPQGSGAVVYALTSVDPLTDLMADPGLRADMRASGRARAEEFSWERVTAKVDDYYGFVIRRLAARGELPEGFRAAIPPPQRTPPVRIA